MTAAKKGVYFRTFHAIAYYPDNWGQHEKFLDDTWCHAMVGAGEFLYASETGDGRIAQIAIGNKRVDRSWVTGLTKPRPVAATDKYLYVAEQGTDGKSLLTRVAIDDKTVDRSWAAGLTSRVERAAATGKYVYVIEWLSESNLNLSRISLGWSLSGA